MLAHISPPSEGGGGMGEDAVPYVHLNHGLVREVLQVLYIGDNPLPLLSLAAPPTVKSHPINE